MPIPGATGEGMPVMGMGIEGPWPTGAGEPAAAAGATLFGTRYGLRSRYDGASVAATRLANDLGFGQYVSGRTATAWPPRGRGSRLGANISTAGAGGATSSYPPIPREKPTRQTFRFGAAGNPYLSRRLGGDLGLGRPGTGRATAAGGSQQYTAPMAPPHMVREGFFRPRPELSFPVASGRMASDRGGGRWFNAPRGGRRHDEIDFEAPPGTRITSSVDGVVTKIGNSYPSNEHVGEPTYRYIEVTTGDGYVTRHHYVDPAVKLGDRVRAGETQIGVAQDITQRYSDVPYHVHFEMRNSGKPRPTQGQIMRRTHAQSKIDYNKMSPLVDPTNLFSWRYVPK